MSKRLLKSLAFSLVLVLSGSTAARADPLPPDLNEVVDPPISALDILNTSALGPLDVDPTPLIVTDTDLADAGVLVVPQVLVDPTNFVVDDDGLQCPNADFTTISAAVAASLPDGRIRVCPGEYRESVRILTAGLVLQAPRHHGQATECKTDPMADPTRHAIVLYNNSLNGGNPSVGFQVEADNVVIDGFVVQPDPAFVAANGVGIFTSRFFSGYDIRHNVVQRNTFGVYFNSSSVTPARSFVRENCVRNNRLPGASSGNGIYSDQGLHLAEIQNNSLTGNLNAVVIDTFLTTPSDVLITHNESIDDGAIAVFNSTRVGVTHNKTRNSAGSGVVLFNVSRGEVAFNDLQGGINNGISLSAARDVFVKSNRVAGFRMNGVRLGSSSTNNIVETNRSEDNAIAGMRLTGMSSGNTIRNNHMRGNVPDCFDDTTGAGTAGTANFWINDMGRTQNRPGLCKHASP